MFVSIHTSTSSPPKPSENQRLPPLRRDVLPQTKSIIHDPSDMPRRFQPDEFVANSKPPFSPGASYPSLNSGLSNLLVAPLALPPPFVHFFREMSETESRVSCSKRAAPALPVVFRSVKNCIAC